jgi:uncharacterized protein YecT (DUF1311 family)
MWYWLTVKGSAMRVRRIDCEQLLGSLTLLILTSSCSWAHAASFDCNSTSLSRIEKTICSSKELNAMDSDMDGIYREMQNLARDPIALLRSQRDWLTGRNRCDSTECLKRSYSARLAQLRATAQARWVNFADAGTGRRFRYLGNRSVKRCPDQPANPCFQLSGPKMAYGSDYLLRFEVTKGSPEAVADYNFEKQGDKWVAGGRGGSRSDVEVFAGERWRGLVTSTICGVFTPQGFHGAAGDCYTYLMSNGERSVVMTTDGVSGNDAETLATIRSVELLEK